MGQSLEWQELIKKQNNKRSSKKISDISSETELISLEEQKPRSDSVTM